MIKVSINLQFTILVVLYYSCTFVSISNGKNMSHKTERNLSIRAVNLGGWLVTEGWIKPSLFYGIPNKDLLDGTQLQFKSTSGKYLSVESGGGNNVVANKNSASGWETFTLWRVRDTIFYLRVFNKQFMGMNSDGIIVTTENTPSLSQEFQIERNPKNPTLVRIMAHNGRYIQVNTEELIITADSRGDAGWGDDDPSIFQMNITSTLHGEFQLTNGYGPVKAPQVMREHWNTFIVEKDFKFISRSGVNAVRIPVGWWIASDPSPPEPYVGGSLQTLDKAFLWARKYDIKVIIDLHAAPGSQNHWEHSSSRDGSQEWGNTDESIQQTVSVIEFLTSRYATNPSLYAVELMNEPVAPGVSLETLKKYYKVGYNIVRKYSKTVYVVMSNRLNISDESENELISFASGLEGSVIDVHYYNLFDFDGLTVDQNIDIIKKNRTAQLSKVTTSNGPLTFVGEWVGEWKVKNASKADYKRFGKAQVEVYGKATFGWAYWTYKNVQKHWSFEWMIKNGYIKLK